MDIKANGEGAAAEAEANKQPRYTINLSATTASSSQATAVVAVDLPSFTVGSVTAVEDFQALLTAIPTSGATNASDLIKEAIRTMMDVIERNVTIGASNASSDLAGYCLGIGRNWRLLHARHCCRRRPPATQPGYASAATGGQ